MSLYQGQEQALVQVTPNVTMAVPVPQICALAEDVYMLATHVLELLAGQGLQLVRETYIDVRVEVLSAWLRILTALLVRIAYFVTALKLAVAAVALRGHPIRASVKPALQEQGLVPAQELMSVMNRQIRSVAMPLLNSMEFPVRMVLFAMDQKRVNLDSVLLAFQIPESARFAV